MRTVARAIAYLSLLCLPLCTPLFAVGPVDGEVSAVWWANDFDSDTEGVNTSSDAGAPGLRAQLWLLNRYGMAASRYDSEPDASDGADYTSVDFMWRALSPTENNYVAVGLGWQQMDVQGFADETSGMRVSVQGRASLIGVLHAYGQGSYLPSLDDADAIDPLLGRFEDIDAFEYELGVAWNAAPFLDVHAGYRTSNLSYTRQAIVTSGSPAPLVPAPSGGGGMSQIAQGGGSSGCTECLNAVMASESGETESSGFFVGVGVHF